MGAFSEKNKATVICNICSLTFAYKNSSTSSLKRHLERKHDAIVKKTKPAAATSSSTPTASSSSSTTHTQSTIAGFLASKAPLKPSNDRAQNITRLITHMFALDLQPLNFIENTGFRNLLKYLEGRYVIPSRALFRNKHIPELYNSTAKQLRSVIQGAADGLSIFSITTDAWTARTLDSYVTYTLHIIDKDYKLKSFVVGTYVFEHAHTAANLRGHILATLSTWGILKSSQTKCSADNSHSDTSSSGLANITAIEDDDDSDSGAASTSQLDILDCCDSDDNDDIDANEEPYLSAEEEDLAGASAEVAVALAAETPTPYVRSENEADATEVYITTDNASNVSKAVRESGLNHIRCFAHTINLAVQKGVAVFSPNLSRIRKITRFYHKSTKAKYELEVSFIR